MESMDLMPVLFDRDFWQNKRVLLTGHTGFKGGWMALWLTSMGARVSGLALLPDTTPNFYDLACVAGGGNALSGEVLRKRWARDLRALSGLHFPNGAVVR